MDDTTPSPSDPQEPVGPSRGRRGLLIGLGATAGLLALIAAVGLIDPFGLHLLDRLTGRYDPGLAAMPPEVILYFGLDLSKDNQEAIDRWIRTFAIAAGEEDFDMASLYGDLDRLLSEENGMTVEADLLPWVGRHLSVGLIDFDFNQFAGPESARWVAAVEVRDKKLADAFVEKLGTALEGKAEEGVRVSRETYNGVALTSADSETPFERVAFARAGDVALFASDLTTLKSAIGASRGPGLQADEAYQKLADVLPESQILTVYIQTGPLLDMLTDMQQGFGPGVAPGFQRLPIGGVRLELAHIESGMLLDLATQYDLGELSESQMAALDLIGAQPVTDDLVPGSSLVYLNGRGLSLFWESMQTSTQEGGQDFAESYEVTVAQLGFDPADLFEPLDGEYAIVVLPKQGAALPSASEVPLEAALLAGTGDEARLSAALDKATMALEEQLFLQVDRNQEGDFTVFRPSSSFTGGPGLVFGVGRGYLFVASSDTAFRDLFDGGAGLAAERRYQQVWAAFPQEMAPVLYVDVSGLVEAFRPMAGERDSAEFEEAVRALKPLTAVAAATGPLEGDLVRGAYILFIETIELPPVSEP
jgi:hypothetical protein